MSDFVAIPPHTRQRQMKVSDPQRSAWVSANAGSGKTYVLAQRVIRLMLEGGVEPGKILCLTFTRAAAAQMANRVFDRLGSWAQLDDTELASALAEICGEAPDRARIERARTLFARALDTPGGLKIQTIHAFCEALLHQFPLESRLPGRFQVIEADRQAELVAEARAQIEAGIHAGGKTEAAALGGHFAALMEAASDHQIEKALGEIIARREELTRWIDGDVPAATAPMRTALGLTRFASRDALIEQALAASDFGTPAMAQIAEAAAGSQAETDRKFAEAFDKYRQSSSNPEKFRTRNGIFLTRSMKPRKNVVTNSLVENAPDRQTLIETERERVLADNELLRSWDMLAASEALFAVGMAIVERYETLKRDAGLCDFQDLITAAAELLRRSDIRDWVRYKLDRGIDHVLIDEAQDTSPLQWEIINAIVEEFHAGQGSGPSNRTVFAVGDHKQSIYSFQGADPSRFGEQATRIGARAKAANHAFSQEELQLSFRSVRDILDAVDRVFANPDNARGVSQTGIVHESLRVSGGEVRIWPIETRERAQTELHWLAPIDVAQESEPQTRLARRIAACVRGWIERSERLPGRNRAIRCGDILILVRRRDGFINAVIREMKAAGLAIAGADRLILNEHIAVEDLMALGRFALMPEDDLSLAAALKSPLFEFDDAMLIEIAHGRNGTLYDRMRQVAGSETKLAQAAGAALERLDRHVAMAGTADAHAFYASILGREKGREAFLARLGNEVEDVLDAFEQAVLDHERDDGPGLQSFLGALATSAPEIKRETDMSRDEVRVITVHAAKGLEAPIVFLVDPCLRAFMANLAPRILPVRTDTAEGWLWQIRQDRSIAATREAMATIQTAAEEEYRRLLYVGMTRAADRLIVCGWAGDQTPRSHWHSMVSGALSDEAQTVTDAEGRTELVWRSSRRPAPALPPEPGEDSETGACEMPDWLFSRPPREETAAAPLRPSAALEPAAPPPSGRAPGAEPGAGRSAREFGIAVHRLIERLPGLPQPDRADMARQWLEQHFPDWPETMLEAAIASSAPLIDHPALEALFGPDARAEIAVTGTVVLGQREIAVSGQIDRMAVGAAGIVLADFKTSQAVAAPGTPEHRSHVAQMALYRELMRAIYPGRPVRCLLVWTRSQTVENLPDAALDDALTAV